MAPTKFANDTPLLSQKHSGIPERLSKEAKEARERLWSNKTLPDTRPRQRAVVLPPNVTKDKFDAAVKDLRQQLGSASVELNDKPLQDGWYMEHP
jgi:hypothetical protein